ncbi:MAG: hypothetical protein LBG87_09225 [Spirochaetaceae bacterium]|nr:hypothetical protein [Spirochaetaceae bacterium]
MNQQSHEPSGEEASPRKPTLRGVRHHTVGVKIYTKGLVSDTKPRVWRQAQARALLLPKSGASQRESLYAG